MAFVTAAAARSDTAKRQNSISELEVSSDGTLFETGGVLSVAEADAEADEAVDEEVDVGEADLSPATDKEEGAPSPPRPRRKTTANGSSNSSARAKKMGFQKGLLSKMTAGLVRTHGVVDVTQVCTADSENMVELLFYADDAADKELLEGVHLVCEQYLQRVRKRFKVEEQTIVKSLADWVRKTRKEPKYKEVQGIEKFKLRDFLELQQAESSDDPCKESASNAIFLPFSNNFFLKTLKNRETEKILKKGKLSLDKYTEHLAGTTAGTGSPPPNIASRLVRMFMILFVDPTDRPSKATKQVNSKVEALRKLLVIFNNFMPLPTSKYTHTFDLKGSSAGRTCKKTCKKDSTCLASELKKEVRGPKSKCLAPGVCGPSAVKKDEDFRQAVSTSACCGLTDQMPGISANPDPDHTQLRMVPDVYEYFKAGIAKDVKTLAFSGLLDYSLLMRKGTFSVSRIGNAHGSDGHCKPGQFKLDDLQNAFPKVILPPELNGCLPTQKKEEPIQYYELDGAKCKDGCARCQCDDVLRFLPKCREFTSPAEFPHDHECVAYLYGNFLHVSCFGIIDPFTIYNGAKVAENFWKNGMGANLFSGHLFGGGRKNKSDNFFNVVKAASSAAGIKHSVASPTDYALRFFRLLFPVDDNNKNVFIDESGGIPVCKP